MKILTLLGCLFVSLTLSAFQVSTFENTAVAVNKFTLFPDSTFYEQSNIVIAEGETFDVINETKLLHEDDAQLQKYKWYQVRLKSETVGWAFGNNIAIFDKQMNNENALSKETEANLSANFHKAKLWQASIRGRDSKSATKKEYIEKYLVFTNGFKQSRYIQIGREQVEGKSWAENVQMADLNSDGFEEVIIELKSQGAMSETVNQYLEIFTMKHDAIQSIYSEKINLGRRSKNISPINQKFFDVEEGSIRVAYIDYFDCSDSFGGSCMEYVTYSYAWDQSKQAFETLYEPSRTSPVVKPKSNNLYLFPGPGLYQKVGSVGTRETLKVLGQEVKHYKVGSTVEKKIFFYVETAWGKKGFIESSNVEFIENDYSKALNSYYQHPSMNTEKYGKDILAVQVEESGL